MTKAAAIKPTIPKLDEIKALAQRFETADPAEIVDWAINRFPSRLALSVSFGGDGGTVLAHMIAKVVPPIPVLFLDTGLLFADTYRFRDRLAGDLGLTVRDIRPELTVEEQAIRHGANLWELSPDQCCQMRKVEPMRRALAGYDAWITGIRRSQSALRAHVPVMAYDSGFGVIKLCPLANATDQFVRDYITRHNLPHNPLQDLGYASIGCWPCTSKITTGEDARAGRWRNRAKTECGLHAAGTANKEPQE